MSDPRKAELIRYRVEQAEEALRDAQALMDNDSLRASVNRSYYAMFYSVLALLITRDLGTSKHSGAISLFDREFKTSGIFSKELSDWLHDAFNFRVKADYRELVSVSKGRSEEILSHARSFFSQVKRYLVSTTDGINEN